MVEDVNAKLLIQSKLRQTFARISWSAKGVHIELRIALRVPIRPWEDYEPSNATVLNTRVRRCMLG